MNRHPAHRMAVTVMDAAEELHGYMDPDDPFPWELTEDDHRDLLPCLERAIIALGDAIRGIAQVTGDEYAQQRLTDSYHRLVQAKASVGLAMSVLVDEPGEDPETAAEAAGLAASSFPQPMTASMLQKAATAPIPPGTPATAPRPGKPSPGQNQ